MFGKIGSAFEKAKSTLSSFSFGKKSSESSSGAEALPAKIDPRQGIQNSVNRVLEDDTALDNWAAGNGWKSNDFVATMSGVNSPDLSAFQQATSGRETEAALAGTMAQVESTLKLNKSFEATMGADETPDLSVFRRELPNGETPGTFGAAFMENGKTLRAVPSRAHGPFGLSLETAEPERRRLPDPAPYFDFAKVKSYASTNEIFETPAAKWTPGAVDTRSARGLRDNVRQLEPRLTERELPTRTSPGAVRLRILSAVAALMATVGGVAHVASARHDHHNKASYSVDDIVPLNNAQAAQLEAQRAARQGAPVEIAQR